MKRRVIVGLTWLMAVLGPVAAEDPETFTPVPLELTSTPGVGAWRKWEGIADMEGRVSVRERITALSSDGGSVIRVGTSHGRLITLADGKWTLLAHCRGLQVTGIASGEPGTVWLSTSDGLRRLDRDDEGGWRLKTYRTYYEGRPSFVSGAYLPGEDAVRSWGHVDAIYIPAARKTYSPFAISTEHGLFSWGGYHGVWHHFMPHYWGANSPWLDTRDLIPRRRPTCMSEDGTGNLWIGTHGDGIVRLNARARDYCDRKSEDNQRDGTEFSSLGPKEVGAEFDKVVDISPSGKGEVVWFLLQSGDGRSTLARFDGKGWTTFPLPGKQRTYCVAELKADIVLVGTERGLLKVVWSSREARPVPGPEHGIRRVVPRPDGGVFAASWWTLFERVSAD